MFRSPLFFEEALLVRIMFVGDVVGRKGVDYLSDCIYKIKQKYDVDITVVNGENSADDGRGITASSLAALYELGADVVTTGNHCFDKKGCEELFSANGTLLRPDNYPDGAPGSGCAVVDFGAYRIAVVNLSGVVFMEPLDNPFLRADSILKKLEGDGVKNIFVDFHAEATSEKKALGQYLAGRATAVVGTHTHVQTSDEVILNSHTAYISDVGMTGPELSVLGVESSLAIKKQITHRPVRFSVSDNPCFLNAVVIDFDEKLGISNKIERVIWR